MILGLSDAGTIAHVTRGGVTTTKGGKRTLVLPPLVIRGRVPKGAKKPAGLVAKAAAALTATPTAAVVEGSASASAPLPSWLWLAGLGLVGYLVLGNAGGGGRRRARNPRTARNPGGPHRHPDPDVRRAAQFRREFAWGIPSRVVRFRPVSPRPRVQVELGRLKAVTYETKKRGERARYFVHDFEGRRPHLVMDVANKRLHISGGSYTVTDRGIEG